jgi:hypothetical protein
MIRINIKGLKSLILLQLLIIRLILKLNYVVNLFYFKVRIDVILFFILIPEYLVIY